MRGQPNNSPVPPLSAASPVLDAGLPRQEGFGTPRCRLRPFGMLVLGLLAGLLGMVQPAQAQEGQPYVYQRTGFGQQGRFSLTYEGALGTREARSMGQEGLEQGLTARVGLTDRVSLEAWGGLLFDLRDQGQPSSAARVEANAGILRQEAQLVNLSVGVGCSRDFREVVVPRLRVTASRSFGPVDVTVNALAEVPLETERDAVDVLLGAGVSYAVGQKTQLGVEVLGEDLEGFWDPYEAEGGARILAGPSARFSAGDHLDVRAHAGLLVAGTTSVLPNGQPMVSSEPGFLGRVAVTYAF